MKPPTPRHAFLRELHKILRPQGYLEIGVWFGHSLALAELDTPVIVGVDPNPLVGTPLLDAVVRMTSDQYFATYHPMPWVDLAYIDGMHLIENVVRDFIGVEERARPGCVVAVDDVFPYAWSIAGRDPLPGDWTGDVWKLWPILTKWRPELKITMVDVDPTGVMVVQGLDPIEGPVLLRDAYPAIVDTWAREVAEQPYIVGRVGAVKPGEALKIIEKNRT